MSTRATDLRFFYLDTDNLKSSSTERVGIPYASLGSSPQGFTLRQCIDSKDVYSSRVCFFQCMLLYYLE